jgi:hypothetical protein
MESLLFIAVVVLIVIYISNIQHRNDTLNVLVNTQEVTVVLDKAYKNIKFTFSVSESGYIIPVIKIIDSLSWVGCTASSSPNFVVDKKIGDDDVIEQGYICWLMNGGEHWNAQDFFIVNIENAHFPIGTNILYSTR